MLSFLRISRQLRMFTLYGWIFISIAHKIAVYQEALEVQMFSK